LGDLVQVLDQQPGVFHQLGAQRGVFRRVGQGLHGGRQLCDLQRGRGVGGQRAEQVLNTAEEIVLHLDVAHLRQRGANLLDHELVDRAGDGRDLDA
jgi:hypothetical protein